MDNSVIIIYYMYIIDLLALNPLKFELLRVVEN